MAWRHLSLISLRIVAIAVTAVMLAIPERYALVATVYAAASPQVPLILIRTATTAVDVVMLVVPERPA